YLLTRVLPDRLGKAWAGRELNGSIPADKEAPPPTEAEIKRMRELSNLFLQWYTPGQEKISYALVAAAAECEGAYGVKASTRPLSAILSTLPPQRPPKRSFDAVQAEMDKLPAQVVTTRLKRRS